MRKRGLIVLISDLLAPADSLQTRLGYLRSRGHDVVVLRVLDPAEVNFTFTTPAMFHDVESGKEMYIDPAAAREGYLRKFAAHAAQDRASRASIWGSNTSRSRPTGRSSWCCSICSRRGCAGCAGRAAGLRLVEEVHDELPHAAVRPRAHGASSLRSYFI